MFLSNGMNSSQELFCSGIPASIFVFNPKILITLMVINTFTSITATIGNLLVLITIWRSPNLHSPSNTFLFGLALSDLCVGVVSEPLNVGFHALLFKNSSKIPPCTLVNARTFVSTFLTLVTMLTVTAMSIDRYLAIHLNLRYEQVVIDKNIWLIGNVPSISMIFHPMISFFVGPPIIAVCLVIISFAWIKIYQVVRNHQVQIFLTVN